jgi:hypothetical protein
VAERAHEPPHARQAKERRPRTDLRHPSIAVSR